MTIGQGYTLATDKQFQEVSNFATPPKAGVITAVLPSGQVTVDTDDAEGGDVTAWPLNGFTYAVGDVVYVGFAGNNADSAIVIGSKAPLPVLDPSVLSGNYVELDGSTPLTADWNIGEDRRIKVEAIRARDGEGIVIETDDGFDVMLIGDDGKIDIRRSGSDGPMLVFNDITITESGVVFYTGFNVGNADADDVNLTIVRDTATNAMMGAGVGSDTFRRIVIQADGKYLIGDGSSTRDVSFERSAAGELTFSGRIIVVQATVGNEVQRLQSTATNDDPRESVYQNRVATTNATITTLHTFTIPSSTTYMIEAVVTARRTGGSAGTAEDGAGYKLLATFKNVSGTATQIGATTVVATHEDQAAWDCVFDATGATARVRVAGAANNNVTWHMTARVWQVGS